MSTVSDVHYMTAVMSHILETGTMFKFLRSYSILLVMAMCLDVQNVPQGPAILFHHTCRLVHEVTDTCCQRQIGSAHGRVFTTFERRFLANCNTNRQNAALDLLHPSPLGVFLIKKTFGCGLRCHTLRVVDAAKLRCEYVCA